jgi:hypothetical protein
VWAALHMTTEGRSVTAHEHSDSLSDIILKRLSLFKRGIMGRKQVDQSVCGRLHHFGPGHTESIQGKG